MSPAGHNGKPFNWETKKDKIAWKTPDDYIVNKYKSTKTKFMSLKITNKNWEYFTKFIE